MPGRIRHSKGKHPVRSKRKRSGQSSTAVAAQRTPNSQTNEVAPQPEVSAPSQNTSASSVTINTVRYPYIVAELRRIGILAGITLLILVVLALVLS
jgi:hypothetical protein